MHCQLVDYIQKSLEDLILSFPHNSRMVVSSLVHGLYDYLEVKFPECILPWTPISLASASLSAAKPLNSSNDWILPDAAQISIDELRSSAFVQSFACGEFAMLAFGFRRTREIRPEEGFPWHKVQSITFSQISSQARGPWGQIFLENLSGPQSILESGQFSVSLGIRLVHYPNVRQLLKLKKLCISLTLPPDNSPIDPTIDRTLFPRTLKLPALQVFKLEMKIQRSGQQKGSEQREWPLLNTLPIRSWEKLRTLILRGVRIESDVERLVALFGPMPNQIERLTLDCLDIDPLVLMKYFAEEFARNTFRKLRHFVLKVCVVRAGGFPMPQFSDSYVLAVWKALCAQRKYGLEPLETAKVVIYTTEEEAKKEIFWEMVEYIQYIVKGFYSGFSKTFAVEVFQSSRLENSWDPEDSMSHIFSYAYDLRGDL
ncbi:hypothetical protein C0991_007212 [Blastosporella zonata]|nr:hypothetical protein C0991_007212 [Blastosporella zonata]